MSSTIKDKLSVKVVGYCRVSTENQREEGTIQIQEKALIDYCRENRLELMALFKDNGVSGGLENRPALSELFDYLENNSDIESVVIFKLDRLARDLYIQEHLIKKLELLDKKLISIKEPNLDSKDPMRKAFRQFMGIVSELEKAFITMRLSGGRINKAKKGGYAGGGPAFGYLAKNKDLKVNDGQTEIVKQIFKIRRYKKLSFAKIARYLNNLGVKTVKGGKWYASTVKYIVGNPIYKGKLRYKDQLNKRKDLGIV
ncbi:MAG: recombinase family protein [Candidatus Margulisbacteria bacterium]|nr:recombinase family protein [Candidatus Margulisiibacteriota bacterium]